MSLGKDPKRDYLLSRLWLEIPLRTEAAEYYSIFPFCEYIVDGNEKRKGTLNAGGIIPEHSLAFHFSAQLYIGNDTSGICFFTESNRNWVSENGYPMEVIRTQKDVILRIRLLDYESKEWKNQREKFGQDLDPINYSFGLIATPVKPFPANPYEEKICI